MLKLTEINNREIQFVEFNTSEDWVENFPNENWCLVIIAEEKNTNYFDEIIRKSIDRNVGYIFSVGNQHDFIHDLADEILLIRDFENLYLPNHIVMTAGDKDFENGIWSGISITHQDETEINQIIILDVARKYLNRTTELIKKFENGYIPED